MRVVQAAWIVPISEAPIRDGWVGVADGRVVGLGGPETVPPGGPVQRLPASAMLPGLVNAHTHLELSWLHGRVQPASSFIDWVTAMMRVRLHAPEAGDRAVQRRAMQDAVAAVHACGTVAVGDVSNSLADLDVLAERPLVGVVFHEVLGFGVADGDAAVAEALRRIDAASCPAGWGIVLAPHAPYSVSASLVRAVRRAAGDGPTTVHVAESVDEVTLVQTGGGRWRTVLERLGAWSPSWQAPGVGPVAYLDTLGFWRTRTLAVHGVQAGPDDLELLRDRDVTLVTCPRSNVFVGSGAPPVAAFYASGVRVAIGTDSLASVQDLNVFAELAALRRLAPDVPAARLLQSATQAGAEALGLSPEYGAIVPGSRDALLAVDVPSDVTDVEEYLVSGIEPAQVRWLDEIAGYPGSC